MPVKNSVLKNTIIAVNAIPNTRQFADRIGITTQQIYGWKRVGVSAKFVLDLEKEINYKVTRVQLRPDIFKERN